MDLGLYKRRPYVETLQSALAAGDGPRLAVAQALYIAIGLTRYAWAILACPWMLVLRWGVTVAAYLRMTLGRNALPDIL